MRTIRYCPTGELNTGVSLCPVDFKHIKGAILVEENDILSTGFTEDDLEKWCHGKGPNHVMPIKGFVDYAKEGGEAQVNANGYGASVFSGLSQQTDTFTLDRFYPELHAALLKAVNYKFGVYYYTKDNMIIGLNNGVGALKPIPVTLVPNATPLPSSGGNPTQTVGFAYQDTEYVHKHYDYMKVGFTIENHLIGLVPVLLQKDANNKWHVIEAIGGLDRTAEYGSALAGSGSAVVPAASTITYANGVLTITLASGQTDADVKLVDSATLYDNDVFGIVQWKE